MKNGIFERFQSCRSHDRPCLWAHVLTSLASNGISLVIIVLVAIAMGFRTSASPLAWLAVAGILALFTLALTWLAIVAGLTAKTVDGAGGFSYPLILLPFISSAFVPTATMPGPVRAFAEHQPVTLIVNTIQDLFAERPVGSNIWIALAWCLGVLILAYLLAMGSYLAARRPRRGLLHYRSTRRRHRAPPSSLPMAVSGLSEFTIIPLRPLPRFRPSLAGQAPLPSGMMIV